MGLNFKRMMFNENSPNELRIARSPHAPFVEHDKLAETEDYSIGPTAGRGFFHAVSSIPTGRHEVLLAKRRVAAKHSDSMCSV